MVFTLFEYLHLYILTRLNIAVKTAWQMGVARSADDKKRLREHAALLISGDETIQLAPDETTGENDFKYKRSPDVCGVVVDKGSGSGYAQITGEGKETQIFYTGREHTGFAKADILPGQSCMLYGEPTVLYIVPRT